ncbi:hemoglobin [Chitinophaga japonensis]|uniref:Hemoglobin n=2 Tax=Chitinophaga japonensis TaxID=104662 RepID=A0A562ST97_CHIJA|nr:hemoglobin [Chitinophaga japonensis]
MKDITVMEDIQLLVNTFYEKVQADELLGPIFNGVIQDRWPVHLEKMYRFWQTVLLEEHTYFGRPFPPHAQLPIEQAHFDTWLRHWHETVDSLFAGPKAEEAKWRGGKMALMFMSKLDYYRNGTGTPLL